MPGMLNPFRRHTLKCPHRAKGKAWRRCRCPLHVEGMWRGTYLRRSLNTRSWETAAKIVREIEGGEAPQAEVVTVANAVALHAADLAARNVAPATRKKYRQMGERLNTFCGERGAVDLRELTTPFLREFRATWKVSPITANKILERVRAFMGWCVASGWIETNPASGLKRSVETNPPTMPFTDDELVRITRALDNHRAFKEGDCRWRAERLRALVLVLRYTGLRIQDAVKLTRSQVQGNRILLRQTKTGEPVTMIVPGEVIEALDFIAKDYRDRYFAPEEAKGETAAGNWRRKLRWLFTAAKVEGGHAHRFRDTLAVNLLSMDVPVEAVAMILGHGDPKITMKHYAPWVKSRQAALDDHIRKTWHRTSMTQEGDVENLSDWKQSPVELVSRAGLEPATPTESTQVTDSSLSEKTDKESKSWSIAHV